MGVMRSVSVHALISPDPDGGFVSLAPEYDVASQGETADEAAENLAEALSLFFEFATEAELNRRQHRHQMLTVAVA
jgi:predicted RNase H-like HicB family nuclease